MDLVKRVTGIVLNPRAEWVKIKSESSSVSKLFFSYVLVLAAVTPLIRFLSNLLYGNFIRPYAGWSGKVVEKDLLFSGILYILSIILVYISGKIINVLAPSFSGKRSRINSIRLAVYCMIPYWLGGVLYLVPEAGWILKVIAGFYGIYVLYTGIAVSLMNTPQEKVFKYLAVVSIIITVLIACVEIFFRILFTLGGIVRVI